MAKSSALWVLLLATIAVEMCIVAFPMHHLPIAMRDLIHPAMVQSVERMEVEVHSTTINMVTEIPTQMDTLNRVRRKNRPEPGVHQSFGM